MHIHYISEENSILNHFLAQIRDVNIQKDSMRFRKNIERIGEIMAYELSKTLDYKNIDVQTPLGIKHTTSLISGDVIRNVRVMPKGMPACTNPIKSGTDEQEQNGVTAPKKAAMRLPTPSPRFSTIARIAGQKIK